MMKPHTKRRNQPQDKFCRDDRAWGAASRNNTATAISPGRTRHRTIGDQSKTIENGLCDLAIYRIRNGNGLAVGFRQDISSQATDASVNRSLPSTDKPSLRRRTAA